MDLYESEASMSTNRVPGQPGLPREVGAFPPGWAFMGLGRIVHGMTAPLRRITKKKKKNISKDAVSGRKQMPITLKIKIKKLTARAGERAQSRGSLSSLPCMLSLGESQPPGTTAQGQLMPSSGLLVH